MKAPVVVGLGALGIAGVHFLVRLLNRRLEDEYVKYPHRATTNFAWLPVAPALFSVLDNPLREIEIVEEADKDGFYEKKARLILGSLLGYWDLSVHEPKKNNWEYIDHFVRSPDAMYWHWLEPYEERNQSLWCGAFATVGFGAAGLKQDIRQIALASTARVQEWLDGTGRYKGEPHQDRRVFARNSKHTYGNIEDIRPGDLVIVGKGDKAAGNHIATALATPYDLDTNLLQELVPQRVIEAVPDDVWAKFVAKKGLLLVEGNATGYGPGGDKFEGVVVQFRPTIENREKSKQQAIMHAVRFKPEDYER